MECGSDEASQKGMICPPSFPSCLPLSCFFSGTSGTLAQRSPVTLSAAGFRLSHSGWDTGRFDWDTVGHFVPVAPFCAVLRKDLGGRFSRLNTPGSVNFGAKPIPPAAHIRWLSLGATGNIGALIYNSRVYSFIYSFLYSDTCHPTLIQSAFA